MDEDEDVRLAPACPDCGEINWDIVSEAVSTQRTSVRWSGVEPYSVGFPSSRGWQDVEPRVMYSLEGGFSPAKKPRVADVICKNGHSHPKLAKAILASADDDSVFTNEDLDFRLLYLDPYEVGKVAKG